MASGSSTVSSTPAKRRKTTWSALLQHVNQRDCPEHIDLENLLSAKYEDAQNFLESPEFVQLFVLSDVLGESSDLIEKVMHSINKSLRSPWNIYDELRSFGIAPSRISASDVVTVACAIFPPTDDEIGDFRAVRKYYIFTKELPPSDTMAAIKDESKKSIEQFEPVLNEALSKTLDVQVSEASTSFILGMFCAKFCTLLTSELLREYKHLPQYTVASNSKAGQNPRSDGAVALVKVINSGASMQSRIPVVLYELKPAVQPTHLMEVMLQGYYCIKLETLLICLFN